MYLDLTLRDNNPEISTENSFKDFMTAVAVTASVVGITIIINKFIDWIFKKPVSEEQIKYTAKDAEETIKNFFKDFDKKVNGSSNSNNTKIDKTIYNTDITEDSKPNFSFYPDVLDDMCNMVKHNVTMISNLTNPLYLFFKIYSDINNKIDKGTISESDKSSYKKLCKLAENINAHMVSFATSNTNITSFNNKVVTFKFENGLLGQGGVIEQESKKVRHENFSIDYVAHRIVQCDFKFKADLKASNEQKVLNGIKKLTEVGTEFIGKVINTDMKKIDDLVKRNKNSDIEKKKVKEQKIIPADEYIEIVDITSKNIATLLQLTARTQHLIRSCYRYCKPEEIKKIENK